MNLWVLASLSFTLLSLRYHSNLCWPWHPQALTTTCRFWSARNRLRLVRSCFDRTFSAGGIYWTSPQPFPRNLGSIRAGPRSAEQTPDPTQARSKSVIEDDESSDEEMPLAARAPTKSNGRAVKREALSDDDDVPLVSLWTDSSIEVWWWRLKDIIWKIGKESQGSKETCT